MEKSQNITKAQFLEIYDILRLTYESLEQLKPSDDYEVSQFNDEQKLILEWIDTAFIGSAEHGIKVVDSLYDVVMTSEDDRYEELEKNALSLLAKLKNTTTYKDELLNSF